MNEDYDEFYYMESTKQKADFALSGQVYLACAPKKAYSFAHAIPNWEVRGVAEEKRVCNLGTLTKEQRHVLDEVKKDKRLLKRFREMFFIELTNPNQAQELFRFWELSPTVYDSKVHSPGQFLGQWDIAKEEFERDGKIWVEGKFRHGFLPQEKKYIVQRYLIAHELRGVSGHGVYGGAIQAAKREGLSQAQTEELTVSYTNSFSGLWLPHVRRLISPDLADIVFTNAVTNCEDFNPFCNVRVSSMREADKYWRSLEEEVIRPKIVGG